MGALLIVIGLLALTGLVSATHPLRSRGSDFSHHTTVVLIVCFTLLAALLIVGYAWWSRRPTSAARRPLGVFDVAFALALVVALALGSYGIGNATAPRPTAGRGTPCPTCPQALPPKAASTTGHGRRAGHTVSWLDIAAVLALLAGGGVLLIRRRPPQSPIAAATQSHGVTVALDQSIDDLRSDPDVRRAVIAAYARMERALGAAGIPRSPAETPAEYLQRSLAALDASAGAAARLTDLFEHAKFSHHQPTPDMREHAIWALLAIRDELTDAQPLHPALD
jgi:hypothetical protein